MSANNILPFAQAGGAYVLTQADYNADAHRGIGNQPGVARAPLVNKALLQASAMAAGLGQFLADNQGTDVSDALLASALSTMISAAVRAASSGGFRDYATISVNTTLTDADLGKVFGISGSTSVTLPVSNAGNKGKAVTLYNLNSTSIDVSVLRQGTDLLTPNAATSHVIGQFDAAKYVSDGAGGWKMVSGSAMNRYAANFASPAGGNTYQRLPSGIIVQWGSVAISGGSGTITFPTAFPNGSASAVIASPNAGATASATCSTGTFTSTNCPVNCYVNGTLASMTIDFVAFGR
jgi:hypothetical protein